MTRFTKTVEKQGRSLNRHARRADGEFYNTRYPYTEKGAKRLYNDVKSDFHRTYARHIQLAERSR